MSLVDILVDIRIELPAYSHSFVVQVDQSSSIGDVKREISKTCTGAPRVDGQRLIYKGRILSDDEKVADTWKSQHDAHTLHLAVHPSAWTSAPPTMPSSSTTGSSTQSATSSMQSTFPRQYAASQRATSRSRSPLETSPLAVVAMMHQKAIHVLMNGTMPPPSALSALPNAERQRLLAVQALRTYGWSWPAILDMEYPPAGDPADGLKYEQVALNGQPYLSLSNPNATPTPIQLHALKVLSYTFPILSTPPPETTTFPPPVSFSFSYTVNPHTNLNEHLQRLGLPPIRLGPGQIPNPNVPHMNPNDPNNLPGAPAPVELRPIPIRAVFFSLILLIFRTIFLLYFFSPSRRPFFALILSAWILYEGWGVVRMIFERERRDRRPAGGDGAADVRGGEQHGNGAIGQNRHRRGAARANRQLHAVLNGLSSLNLRGEERILDSGAPVRPPSLSHRIKSFVALLLLTLHPAVWDHRRAALRRREGRLRTEASAIEAARNAESETSTSGSESASTAGQDEAAKARALTQVHERRPTWVKEYMRRVQTTDWADDV
ncbi:uncharacterized protein LAESUDRAFT_746306 [Laetiporus sulphureus 93-53]|uniref:Ubiquitin-like domain-containing protein n=1 Tax=Laetiporus sulphureus 93-53 TaxID=1314785 RepID=A0A165IBP1_9APHY|nr:uncharacterized protein LAESUDRAFT_746306 [Laetiporus sulphureus 93-53]KZT12857.1 hypothetical protein LAESUDRAFT_746306 [Laetiporus sulphureus 93-53]